MNLSWLLLLAATSTAVADPKKPGQPTDVIDVKPMIGNLDVYKDDLGKFFVAPHLNSTITSDDLEKWVFYGDAKGLYQQRIIGSGRSNQKVEWAIWAPRSRNMPQAEVEQNDKGITLACEYKERAYIKRPLALMPADQAKTFLEHTPLHPPLWQRYSHLLLRDDNGVYYFVDELREEFGGHGFRVFVGQKGSMKEMPMKNVVSDSAGEIFATTGGDLKIVTSKNSEAYWRKGGKKETLTLLDPGENRHLIYSELGVYGSLGAVCDDL